MKNKTFLGIILLVYILFSAGFTAYAENKTLQNNIKEQAINLYKQGDYKEAAKKLESIDIINIDEEELLLLANCYESMGDSKASFDCLIKILKKHPRNPYVYYNLGLLYYKNNDIKAAIENFEKATKYKNKFAPAYYNLGTCYYLLNDYKNAKKYLQKAFKIDPQNPDIVYNYAMSLKALGHSEETGKYFDLYNTLTAEIKNN